MNGQVTLKVKFGSDIRKAVLPSSEIKTYGALTSWITETYNLDSANLLLKYMDGDGDLVTMVNDEDLHRAISTEPLLYAHVFAGGESANAVVSQIFKEFDHLKHTMDNLKILIEDNAPYLAHSRYSRPTSPNKTDNVATIQPSVHEEIDHNGVARIVSSEVKEEPNDVFSQHEDSQHMENIPIDQHSSHSPHPHQHQQPHQQYQQPPQHHQQPPQQHQQPPQQHQQPPQFPTHQSATPQHFAPPPTSGFAPPTSGFAPPTSGFAPPAAKPFPGQQPPSQSATPQHFAPPSMNGAQQPQFPPPQSATPQHFAPPPTSGFAPPISGFAPPTSGFAPPTSGFAPPISGFAPPTSGQQQPPSAPVVAPTGPPPTNFAGGPPSMGPAGLANPFARPQMPPQTRPGNFNNY